MGETKARGVGLGLPHISDRARDLCPLELPVFQSCGKDLPAHQLHHQRLPRRVHPHRVSLVGGWGAWRMGRHASPSPPPLQALPVCLAVCGHLGVRQLGDAPAGLPGRAA